MESSPAKNLLTEIMSSPRGRRQMVVVLAIAVVGIAIWVNMPRTLETCELVQGCQLKKNELQRIQVVLGQAGLNEYQVEGCNIQVPRDQRGLYLQAITEANALPEDLAPQQIESPNLNPFLSRSQQEQVQLAEKKKQVREMVMRLPFVEQAWFEMDRAKSRSSFEQDEQSAVILIQPTEKMRLENSHVETIRGLIAGAIAGIERQSIVVTDLNAGVAFQDIPSINNSSMIAQSSHHLQKVSTHSLGQQAHFENEIREVLSSYQGLQIAVTVDQVETRVEVPDRQAKTKVAALPVMQVGTNGQASVVVPAQKASTVTQVRLVERVKALIGLPESLVLNGIKASQNSSLEELRNSHAYRTQLGQVKSDISNRLRSVLPTSSFTDLKNPGVQISVIEQADQIAAAPAVAWFDQALAKVGGLWGGLAVLLGSFIIVAFVFSGSKKSEEEDFSEAHIFDGEESELVDSAATSDEQAIKQEVSRLIKEDPEAAAQVIKRWIRNAA